MQIASYNGNVVYDIFKPTGRAHRILTKLCMWALGRELQNLKAYFPATWTKYIKKWLYNCFLLVGKSSLKGQCHLKSLVIYCIICDVSLGLNNGPRTGIKFLRSSVKNYIIFQNGSLTLFSLCPDPKLAPPRMPIGIRPELITYCII